MNYVANSVIYVVCSCFHHVPQFCCRAYLSSHKFLSALFRHLKVIVRTLIHTSTKQYISSHPHLDCCLFGREWVRFEFLVYLFLRVEQFLLWYQYVPRVFKFRIFFQVNRLRFTKTRDLPFHCFGRGVEVLEKKLCCHCFCSVANVYLKIIS
jgi:hypothetical protein